MDIDIDLLKTYLADKHCCRKSDIDGLKYDTTRPGYVYVNFMHHTISVSQCISVWDIMSFIWLKLNWLIDELDRRNVNPNA